MNISKWHRPVLTCVCAAVAAAAMVSSRPTAAEEPARQFLEALRQQGLFDLANEYLQQVEKSPLVPQEFRETILFEQGLTLMAVSRTETNFASRQERLDEAQSKFREFLTAQKNHDFAPKAKSELANVLVERARVKMAEVDRAKDAAAKPALLKEARAFYEQAYEAFKESQDEIAKKIDSLPKNLDPVRDKARIEFRDELRADYVKVQMVQATILHEMAETAIDAKEKNELLKRAADAYGEIYKKYRRRLAGMYALLQQGQCYQEMGGEKNITEALAFYQELLENPYDQQPLRVLRTKVMVQAMQAWLHPDQTDKKVDKALGDAGEWIGQIRPDEFRNDDWLKLYYETGRAYKAKLAEFSDEKDPKRALAMKSALALVDHGVKFSTGDMKDKFLTLKTELGGKIEKPPEERPDPKTFAEAYEAGLKSWELIKQHSRTKDDLEKSLKAEKDPAKKAEIEEQLAELQKTMVSTRFDAVDFFRKAVAFTTPEADLDQVNNVRFYLCSLHFTEKNYYDCAAYGEFMARADPGHLAAKYCATLARASWLNLYNQAPEDDNDFEAQQVVDICEFTLDKWGKEDDADDVLITLIKFMVRQKNLDEAKKYLARVDPESPRRGEAEIATGQAMWSTYLKGLQEVRGWERDVKQWQDEIAAWEKGEGQPPEGVTIASRKSQIAEVESKIAPRKTELAPIKDEAQATLKNGIDRMRAKGIDATLATAVLSLCQIYVDAEQAQEAIDLLEDEEIGALTLVKANNEAVDRPGIAQETYKTALRAYIGALPGAANKADLIAKAEGAMDGLKGTVSQDAEGQEKLISIYVTLANDVKNQIDLASPVNKKPLTQGFATFLDKVAATSSDFTVLNWVAEQFYAIGEANDTGQGELPADVKQYYDKAADQYAKLIEKAKGDSSVSANLVVQMRLRMANVLRRQGKYVLAMDQMEEVLKDKKRNSMLNVQVDAANTYMEWAESDLGVDKLYLVAVSGGRRNKAKSTNIWGWSKVGERLAETLNRNRETMDEETIASFTETMHQAKINKAKCYYQYAMAQEDETKRDKFLIGARDDIKNTTRSFPTMSAQWRSNYDKLLREIQTAMKVEVVGLDAFAQPEKEVAKVDGAEAGGGGGGRRPFLMTAPNDN